MAEVMWLTGMRSAELCSLPLNALPENPGALEKETATVKITGKGQKQRAVLFPVPNLFRSIEKYIHMERWRRVKSNGGKPWQCVCGPDGKATPDVSDQSSVLNRTANSTALHIWPHLLARCSCRGAIGLTCSMASPLKVVQMELGHAHMATTERYLHLTERMRSEVIETHNSFVDRLLEG